MAMGGGGGARGDETIIIPHGLFPEFKVIGGENAIVCYPVIKTKNKNKKETRPVNFQTVFQA